MGIAAEKFSASPYEYFLDRARRADLIVANVFEAMSAGQITETECKEVLKIYERAKVPLWQRVITSS